MGRTALSVNLNKVALLRNQREVGYPSVTEAARTCIDAGADGITVHPRPDQRHIRYTDVDELAQMLTVEFNIEGNPEPQFMALVERIKPAQCTLVPDSPEQSTSDHGWDLGTEGDRLKPVISRLHALGIRVSLFMDAQPAAMALAADIGADRVELYTEPYAVAYGTSEASAALGQFAASAQAAIDHGMGVNAGHDLTLANLPAFVSAVPQLLEVSIGHAFVADALWLGMEETVKRYQKALASP
ncbi:MAG: pyridoxine 5'-phosphate synthase [Chromatiales bacterium]|jgi:pyridoxine 5-phosphate synthase|nr:pyridoxine 5'-phosphate synthase [Chromatiales bacterium]